MPGGRMKRRPSRSARFLIVSVLASAALVSMLAGATVHASGVWKSSHVQASTLRQAGGVCGDLNGDNTVNVFDAITMLQIAVGLIEPTPTQLILGDLNQDGTINVFDGITVLQISVGLITVDACGPPTVGPVIDLPCSCPGSSRCLLRGAWRSSARPCSAGPEPGSGPPARS